jgi:hypothetical protein
MNFWISPEPVSGKASIHTNPSVFSAGIKILRDGSQREWFCGNRKVGLPQTNGAHQR